MISRMTQHALQIADEMDSGLEKDIREFKIELCDETQLIINVLRRDFSDFVLDPILDVGAGFQAISVQSFPGHDITLLDMIAYDMPSAREKRVTGDFFDYKPAPQDQPKTLLLCHVLQYLDDDIGRLYDKIRFLNPERIVAVVNTNDGAFGNAVTWAQKHLPMANPEVDVPMAPIGYQMTRRSSIAATLTCPDFQILAYQYGRIILDLPRSAAWLPPLQAHLKSLLPTPTITFNQSVLGYEKQKRT